MNSIEFDEFTINLDLYSLSRDQTEIDIGPKALDLLVHLIENKDRVVSKESLRRDLWNGAALSQATIPTCVLELRRSLGESADEPRFIHSHRGRGYRFNGEARRIGGPLVSDAETDSELPFVGRQNELEVLRSAKRTALGSRSGQVLLLSGEAGIGKTRLLAEFLSRSSRDSNIYKALSPSIKIAPAFWPWTQILNAALRDHAGSNKELAGLARRLASALPEIDVPQEQQEFAAAPNSRFAVFELWTQALRCIGSIKPTVFAFEDIHRADPDSLSLLYWVSEAIAADPILLVATHRPYPPNAEFGSVLADIAAMPQTKQVVVAPLSAGEVESLLSPLTPDVERLGASLHARSGGNAFYATRLVDSLNRARLTGGDSRDWADLVLDGKELVARQLSDLPSDTRDTLEVASAIGESFSLYMLARINSLGPQATASVVEPALSAGLVRKSPLGYEFVHSILKDALYSTLATTRRNEIHHQAAVDLEAHTDTSITVAEIADHHFRAIPLSPASVASRYAHQAGKNENSRFAHAQALLHLRRARLLAESDNEVPETTRCEILVELAQATLFVGDREKARRTILDAARIARKVMKPDLLATCALQMSPDFLSIEVGAYDADLVALLEEALAATDPDNLALRATLQARLAQAIQWYSPANRDTSLASEALTTARKASDNPALVAALAAKAESISGPHRAQERLEYILQLGKIAAATGDIHASLLQQTRLISAFLELGQIREIEIENNRYRSGAVALGLPQYAWYPIATDCMLAMLHGDFDEADRLAAQYLSAAGPEPDDNLKQTYAAQFVLRELERDKSAQALPLVESFASLHPNVLSWSAAVPWFQWDSGLHDNARDSINAISESEVHAMKTEPGGGVGLALLAEVTAAIGSEDQCQVLYDILYPISNRAASAGYGVAYIGSFARYAGLVARRLDKASESIDLLRQAVRQEALRQARTWHAYSQIDLLDSIAVFGDRETSDQKESAISIISRGQYPLNERLIRRARHYLRRPDESSQAR